MFKFFSKKPKGEQVVFKIGGMHCTSCAMNIDGALEDTKGILSASTNYATAKTTVEFNGQEINEKRIQEVIEQEGYTISKE